MTTIRKGLSTGYSDVDGTSIKVGDRIQHVKDGVIYTVNKYQQAEGAHGTKLPLRGLFTSHNYRILPSEEPAETDVAPTESDMAKAEAEAVDKSVSVEEARKIIALQDYDDEDLADELLARGYHGELKRTKTLRF